MSSTIQSAEAHAVAIEAHEAAIEAHKDAIARRSQTAAMDAIAQSETANEQSVLAFDDGLEEGALASGEAENALQSWESGNSGVAAHRGAIRFHGLAIAVHQRAHDAALAEAAGR
jgi:hypothetical protein